MRPRNLRRKLRAWNRYARHLERLGQGRIYNAHIHYIAMDTMRNLPSRTIEVWFDEA